MGKNDVVVVTVELHVFIDDPRIREIIKRLKGRFPDIDTLSKEDQAKLLIKNDLEVCLEFGHLCAEFDVKDFEHLESVKDTTKK